MLKQKRITLTIAAVIATLTMAGGVGAVELAAHRAQAQPMQPPPPVVASVAASQHFDDNQGGGDQ
jgi:flagellar basal body-associated protein FliL